MLAVITARTAIVRRDMQVLGVGFDPVSPPAVERLLYEAAARAVSRGAPGRLAVVLHLSRLAPPAPRQHHRRIARALMQDAAGRHDGQVFSLGNGDLALLCAAGMPDLPDVLRRLLRVDTPGTVELVSVWPLATKAASLLAYAEERLRQKREAPVVEENVSGQTAMVDAVAALLARPAITDALQRQTAVLLASDRQGSSLLPLFHELAFSIAALESQIEGGGHVGADPYLFRHLAGRLDQRMLALLCDEAGSGGPLDLAGWLQPLSQDRIIPAVHLNLTLQAIVSPAFNRFAAMCAGTQITAGIEISLIEAAGDPQGFARARARLAEAGLGLVLNGVSHLSLLLSRPGALKPDLLKLAWSPRLLDLPATEASQIDAALQQIGPERVVLYRAETEAALHWGLARGLRRFQGRHVDAMQSASRIMVCEHAHTCSLRQCIDRAAALGRAGRAGCHDHGLLDTGLAAPHRRPAMPSTGAMV